MKIKVLGCSGGISQNARTTCLLIDDDMLIDAGTGLGDLSFDALTKINHIFVTHSHLDHILGIPLLADAVFESRTSPIKVYALRETLEHLKAHIFNWHIWPDFSCLPSIENPIIKFVEIKVGDCIKFKNGNILALPVDHTVPALGFAINAGRASLAFSGDTGPSKALWDALNKIENLTHLIIETSFTNKQENLALISKHFSPRLLAKDIQQLVHRPIIHITHLSPSLEYDIMHELALGLKEFDVHQLHRNDIIEI